MNKIKASIITIGDELLIGQTIDTNSAWIAQQLNAIGIWVQRRLAVGDIKEDILSALAGESSVSEIVLITGGLGPTSDDITKPTLCEYFNTRLVQNEVALQNVLRIYESLGLPVLPHNVEDQSMVPEACSIINNNNGTAFGMWFEREGKIYVAMPGVPSEMQGMMENFVLPELDKKYHKKAVILHQTMITSGLGESSVAERLVAFEAQLPAHIKLAYLPAYSMLKLRLTAFGEDKLTTAAELSLHFHEMKRLLEDIFVTDQDIPLSKVLGQLLIEKGKTVGTAESCTGGQIATWITDVPGSSAYYRGSAITYTNASKIKLLGVRPETLRTYGAVSEATVREMLAGALRLLETDYAIAASGIMGPEGGSPEKPVGTVWVAVGNADKVQTVKYQLRFDRKRNTEMTAIYAMNELRKLILE